MNIMSDLYKRSTSERFRQYFEKSSSIIESHARYSLAQMACSEPQEKRKWENGLAGVPLFWEPSVKTVYTDQKDTHTLVIGPTGSKKSRLVAMPQVRILGSAKENMIITDPKAEIYRRTADYLEKQGYTIFVLNLRDPNRGDAWNPLDIPYEYYRRGEVDRAYEFVNDVSENLMHSKEAHGDPFWNDSAGDFFFGLTILLFKYCKENNLDKNYITLNNVIALKRHLLSQTPKEARSNPSYLLQFANKDPIISANLVGTIETAEETRGGIVSSFDRNIRLFSIQPNLMDMLSGNTISLDRINEEPTAIYIILPDEKTGYHAIGSLFIKQSYEYLIYLAQKNSNNQIDTAALERRVNYIIDEFASLPTIHDFPALITAARSRNIRFTLIAQGKNQLLQRYKEETETIMTNCSNWIILSCREHIFLEEISALCGKTFGNPTLSVVPPDSIQRLEKNSGEALLLSGRSKPFITHLPDINSYDNENYMIRPLEHRGETPVAHLDFGRMPVTIQEYISKLSQIDKS